MDIVKNVVGTNIDINDSNGDRIVDLGLQGNTTQVTSILPSGYTQVDYIQSVQSGTYQYIDTGINADNKLRVVFNGALLNNNAFGAIYDNNGSYKRYHLQSTGSIFRFYSNTSGVDLSTYDTNRHIFDMDVPANRVVVDNISYTKVSAAFDVGLNFWLFKRNSNTTSLQSSCIMKLYSCQMYYDGALVRDFVPCINNSNEVGLYDLVNGVFYGNQGGGSFTYGAAINVPNVYFPQNINVVTGRQNIKIKGKNLFNYHLFDNKDNTTVNNIAFKLQSDGGIKLTGTNSSSGETNFSLGSWSGTSTIIPLDSSKTYTISVSGNTRNEVGFHIKGVKNGTSTKILYASDNISTATITGFTSISHIAVIIYGNKASNTTLYLQIEENSTKTNYEVYKENNYEINLGKNLFNKSTITEGKRIDPQGNPYTDEDYSLSDYIRVEPNTTYIRNLEPSIYQCVALYTSDKKFIYRTYASQSFTTTNNTYYVRFSMANDKVNTTQLEKGSQITSYSAYKTPIELCKINDYQDFIKKGTGKNLFDKNNANILEAYFETTTPTITSNASNRTLYIPCEPNTTYTIQKVASSNSRQIGYTKELPANNVSVYEIENISANATTKTYTTGDEAKYLVCRFYQTTQDSNTSLEKMLDSIQIELGNQATSYEPYGMKDKWFIEKNIGKVILDGTQDLYKTATGTSGYSRYNIDIGTNIYSTDVSTENAPMYCNRLVSGTRGNTYSRIECIAPTTNTYSYKSFNFYIEELAQMTNAQVNNWLASNNMIIYYVYATPSYTEMTDTELISQLDIVDNVLLPYGQVHITVSSEDLPSILSIDYFTQDRYISPSDREALINNTATMPFKINIIKDGSIIKTLDEHSVINIDYEDFRYVDTSSLVIGQFVARKISGTLDRIYTDFEIEDTELNIQMGISINNNTNYYDLGNFLVTKPTDDDVKDKTTFEALDYTKKFNIPFDGTTLIYPCTAQDLAKECCRQAGVELATLMFDNYDFEIPSNQYVEGETCRKVMQDIGKLAYSWVRIDWDNKCYIDFDPQDYIVDDNKITNHNYYDLSLQNKIFGPVNRVVLGMKDIEGENVVIEDSASIATNGVTEIQLYDNNITYTPELRQQAITKATKLFGLTYTPLESNTTGHPWLIGKEKVQVTTMDNDNVYTYPFDRSFAYNGHIKSKLTSKADTKTETEYKNYGDLETLIRKTRIIVDKEAQTITSVVEDIGVLQNTTNTQNTNINNLTSMVNSQGESITALGTRLTQNIDSINASVSSIQQEINNGVGLVKTTSATLDDNGLSISTDTSKIKTTMTNNSFEIKDSGGNRLAFFGYDETEGISKAEMDNLTVTNYFVAGNHRIEKYTEDGEERTGWFYIGG